MGCNFGTLCYSLRLIPMAEIVADYEQHYAGQREVVDWTRPDGVRYNNVPIMYLRQVTAEDYFTQFPHMRGVPDEAPRRFYWEVSVD